MKRKYQIYIINIIIIILVGVFLFSTYRLIRISYFKESAKKTNDKIIKEAYDAKYNELTRKINQVKGERALYSANVEAQQHISRRMREIRACIAEADMLDKFDRVVFESIVEKVIVGDISEDGTIDPYKLTFVLKGMEDRVVSDAKNRYKNLNKKVV